MLSRILEFSVRQRAFVLLATAALIGVGIWSALRLPIDAVPDITNVQVGINTTVPALAPEEIEKLVTFPIESELAGIQGLVELRSLSKFGLSQVTLVFEDGTDIYRVRQLVSERLSTVAASLPAGLTPRLAPISTGLGEIFYYVVDYAPGTTNKAAPRAEQLMELKQIHDTLIKPRLRNTPGLADVNASGGFDKQIVVRPDPDKLRSVGLSFSEVAAVIAENVENAGGGVIELGGELVNIRAAGRVQTTEEIANLPLKFTSLPRALRVRDVAEVGIGSAARFGGATYNGEEAVLGAALMLAGENSRLVAQAVGAKLREIQPQLPPGVRVVPVYDRTLLVDRTIHTVATSLFEGAVLVVVILLLLLGNWRAALIVSLAIPLSLFFAMTGMVQGRVSGNLMSLGAIDFGLIVDGAVVMVENILRHLAAKQRQLGRQLSPAERVEEVLVSAKEVASPMFFGVLIITVVYVPILALTGIEGKMFHPMALTVIFALLGSLVLALTLMPALAALWLGSAPAPGAANRALAVGPARGKDESLPSSDAAEVPREGAGNDSRGRLCSPEPPDDDHTWLMRVAKSAYAPVLRLALGHRWLVTAASLGVFVFAAFLFTRLGGEFMPRLDEGSFTTHMIRTTSIGLGASMEMQCRAEKVLLANVPEVDYTFSRVGTDSLATDPMGPNVGDAYIMLKPREQWRKINGVTATKEQLADIMGEVLGQHVPGQGYLFLQPIEMRFNEIMEGTRADVAVKIFGDDFAVLEKLATEAREILEKVPGAGEVEFDALGKTPMLEIIPKRDAMLRHNLHAAEINRVVATALAGEEVGTMVEGNRRFPIVVRLGEDVRADLEKLKRLPVKFDGGLLNLGAVADFRMTEQVAAITRELGQRRAAVLVTLRGRDVQGFVQDAQQRLAALKLPPGYVIEFGGQFKNLIEAKRRLSVVVPVALALIFVLIFLTLQSLRQTVLVFTAVPLAVTGGVFALVLREMPFSVSAGIGFIALSGIAVLNGLMIVTFFNQLRARGADLRTAVWDGSLLRLRPKLMTALVASLGFLPMAFASGSGAEVQRPLATVVIGGIVTSTFLTLVLLPVLYEWLERKTDSSTNRNNPPISTQ